jgi:hypothetical protein
MTDERSLPVPISELRGLLDAMLSHIEEMNGPIVQIPHDYFWALHAPAIYDFEDSPNGQADRFKQPQLTIGSLKDSWEFLHSDAGHVAYEAVWLGQILTAIGNTVIG